MLTIAKLRRLEEITVREFFHLNLDASIYFIKANPGLLRRRVPNCKKWHYMAMSPSVS